MKYSTGFRNNLLKKVLPPENRSIAEVSKETGVPDQLDSFANSTPIGFYHICPSSIIY